MLDPEKRQQLEVLEDKLLDVYLEEADPDGWTSEESAKEEAQQLVADEIIDAKEAAKLVAGWKGQRYWEKKNANQTMTMLLNLRRFLEDRVPAAAGDSEEVAKQLKKEVSKLEGQVKKRLARTRPQLVVSNK